MLENSLGQLQTSYGFLAETFLRITNNTNLCIFLEWDQFLKGYEDRPVKLVITPSQSLSIDEGGSRDYNDPELAQDNLTFLEQRASNILFPPIANVSVKKGDIFKARIYTQSTWELCQFDIGYDLWLQGEEVVSQKNNMIASYAQLNMLAAARPAALQGKYSGTLTCKNIQSIMKRVAGEQVLKPRLPLTITVSAKIGLLVLILLVILIGNFMLKKYFFTFSF